MKILYVSQYFPPEMGAPAARVHELAREWVGLGHEVTVLTAFPHHPTGVIPAEYRGRLIRREQVDGINVLRVPIYATPNRGVVRRALSYASYAVSAATLGPVLLDKPDVIIGTSPQFLTALAGLSLAALKRAPFIFEVRDLWPRSIVEVGALREGSLSVRALSLLETAMYRAADHIVVVAESSVREIAAQGIPEKKISVVTNGVDLQLFQPRAQAEERRALGIPEGFLATYIGTHGMAHGLGSVLDAAELLKDTPIQFLMVGEGAEKRSLQERAESMQLHNVTFWDQRPRSEVARIISASDVCLCVLRDQPLFRKVIPSKIFEYMGAGKPIVSTVDGEARAIIERAGSGIYSPPEDATALAAALRRLSTSTAELAAMGQAGREHVERYYSRPALARRYLTIIDDVVRRGRGSTNQPDVLGPERPGDPTEQADQ